MQRIIRGSTQGVVIILKRFLDYHPADCMKHNVCVRTVGTPSPYCSALLIYVQWQLSVPMQKLLWRLLAFGAAGPTQTHYYYYLTMNFIWTLNKWFSSLHLLPCGETPTKGIFDSCRVLCKFLQIPRSFECSVWYALREILIWTELVFPQHICLLQTVLLNSFLIAC